MRCPQCGFFLDQAIRTRKNDGGFWCIRSTIFCSACKFYWEGKEGCLTEDETDDET